MRPKWGSGGTWRPSPLHRTARGGAWALADLASGRLSARSGWSGRGAQDGQKSAEAAPHPPRAQRGGAAGAPRAGAGRRPARAPATTATATTASSQLQRSAVCGERGRMAVQPRACLRKRNRCSTAKRRWYQRHTTRRSAGSAPPVPDQPQRLGWRARGAASAPAPTRSTVSSTSGRRLGVQPAPDVEAHQAVVGVGPELGAVGQPVRGRVGAAEDRAVLARRALAGVRPRRPVEAAVGRPSGPGCRPARPASSSSTTS